MDYIRPPKCFLQPNTEGAMLSPTSIETHPPPPVPRALPGVALHFESCMMYIIIKGFKSSAIMPKVQDAHIAEARSLLSSNYSLR